MANDLKASRPVCEAAKAGLDALDEERDRPTQRPEASRAPAPNCPLETGVRPCECEGMPRCPVCNYTEHDAEFEGDHARCPGRIPEESEARP